MLILTAVGILLASCHSAAAVSCMDLNGKPVDCPFPSLESPVIPSTLPPRFVLYKLPKMDTPLDDKLETEGLASLYTDANSGQSTWTRVPVSINDTSHPVARTLLQVYAFVQVPSKGNVYYSMYNDNPPGPGYSSWRGHTKGVQLFAQYSGFWLVHSVPEFPPNNTYSYPESGTRYGQSFLCLTLDTKANLQQIASQLYLYQPEVYLAYLSPDMQSDFPLLKRVIVDGKSATELPFARVDRTLRTQNGVPLVSFAKHRKWDKDLYSELVAPELHESVYVESWQNGGGDLNASCKSDYKTQSILSLNLDGSAFHCSKDHSKWVVTQSEHPAYTCIGDINRQKSQSDRGGGTVCLSIPRLWRLYRAAVQHVQSCSLAAPVRLAPKVAAADATCGFGATGGAGVGSVPGRFGGVGWMGFSLSACFVVLVISV